MQKTEITRDDILDPAAYQATRAERRAAITKLKKNRRLQVGPDATFYFECYETMWYQIHEMLRIEKGGAAQLADELAAYNPLVPNGRELVATLMFEIDEPVRRDAVLSSLGGVEETITLEVDGQEPIRAVAETDVDRTSADGKASSVQFVHFPFDAETIAAFKDPGAKVTLAIGHPAYGHMAVMPDAVRAALAGDFGD